MSLDRAKSMKSGVPPIAARNRAEGLGLGEAGGPHRDIAKVNVATDARADDSLVLPGGVDPPPIGPEAVRDLASLPSDE